VTGGIPLVTGPLPVTFSAYLSFSSSCIALTGVTGSLWGKRDIFKRANDSFRRNPLPYSDERIEANIERSTDTHTFLLRNGPFCPSEGAGENALDRGKASSRLGVDRLLETLFSSWTLKTGLLKAV
jgi:hypothetical protein